MTLALSPTAAPPDSPVRRLDGRWRLLALGGLSAAAAAVQTPAAAAIALLVALSLAALARLPARWFLARLGVLAVAIGPVVLLLPLTAGGGVGWSPEALPGALALGCRSLAVGTLGLVLAGTAPVAETLHAARALGVPAVLVHLLALSWRYTFLLAEEWGRLRTALRTRGFRNRADAHSWQTIGRVAGSLLVRGTDRAERVAAAMRCRGFDGTYRTLADFRTRPTDVLALAAAAGLAAGLLALDCWPTGGA